MVLWDTGSNSHLVLEEYVKENELTCIKKHDSALSAGGSFVSKSTCEVPLKASNGDIYFITAMVVPKITGEVTSMRPATMNKEFGISEDLLDSIIGMLNPVIFPKELRRTDHPYLYRSKFGRGYVASSSSSPVNKKQKYIFATIRSVIKASNQFLAAENMGISPPKICNCCMQCPECDFYNKQESQEAAAITRNQSYNPDNQKWTVAYPKFATPGEVLSNNFNQTVAAHHKLFKRLEK